MQEQDIVVLPEIEAEVPFKKPKNELYKNIQ